MGTWTNPLPLQGFPAKAWLFWCGDHKQTPGGLRKSDEARAFRRKLMRRPIALRGDTKFIPPQYAERYSPSVCARCAQDHKLQGCVSCFMKALVNRWGYPLVASLSYKGCVKETIGRNWDAGITPCCCAAIAVLWLALAPERFPLQADTFSRAAGIAGKQKWSLILPSSARVSELTYVTTKASSLLLNLRMLLNVSLST